jgi:hypothetical protein
MDGYDPSTLAGREGIPFLVCGLCRESRISVGTLTPPSAPLPRLHPEGVRRRRVQWRIAPTSNQALYLARGLSSAPSSPRAKDLHQAAFPQDGRITQ